MEVGLGGHSTETFLFVHCRRRSTRTIKIQGATGPLLCMARTSIHLFYFRHEKPVTVQMPPRIDEAGEDDDTGKERVLCCQISHIPNPQPLICASR